MGSLYWILCLLLGQSTSFAAVHLYLSQNSSNIFASSSDLWALIGVLEATFVVCFAIFVANMAKKYRSTFFSTVTGKKYNHNNFRNATEDSAKFSFVFGTHPSYWADFRDEVEAWLGENYGTWILEKPEWFTESKRSKIPVDMLPKDDEDVLESNRVNGQMRSRSSADIAKEAD